MDGRRTDGQIEALLDINEAARRLGVHPGTLHRWTRARRVPAVRIGRRVLRFDPVALQKFITASSDGPK